MRRLYTFTKALCSIWQFMAFVSIAYAVILISIGKNVFLDTRPENIALLSLISLPLVLIWTGLPLIIVINSVVKSLWELKEFRELYEQKGANHGKTA